MQGKIMYLMDPNNRLRNKYFYLKCLKFAFQIFCFIMFLIKVINDIKPKG